MNASFDGTLDRRVVAKEDLYLKGRKVLSRGRIARVVARDGLGMGLLYVETKCGIIATQRFWCELEKVAVIP